MPGYAAGTIAGFDVVLGVDAAGKDIQLQKMATPEIKVKELEAGIAKLTERANRLQLLVDDLSKKVGH